MEKIPLWKRKTEGDLSATLADGMVRQFNEHYWRTTRMLETDGKPPRIWRNDSPPSSLNQIVPSVMPIKNAFRSSGSPAVARGAALKCSGNPAESLCQDSP